MSVERTETCEACGHPIQSHFRNVVGYVICLHQWPNAWDTGIVQCDCVDYKSGIADRRRQREAKMKDMEKRLAEIPLSDISKEKQD